MIRSEMLFYKGDCATSAEIVLMRTLFKRKCIYVAARLGCDLSEDRMTAGHLLAKQYLLEHCAPRRCASVRLDGLTAAPAVLHDALSSARDGDGRLLIFGARRTGLEALRLLNLQNIRSNEMDAGRHVM